MVSFNILGVCTSRDIFSRTKNNYVVNKYTLGFSPLFCFEKSVTGSVSLSDFLNISYPKGRSNFLRRTDYIEYSRSVFDFLCESKSDYLILDLAMLRSSYFMTEDNSFLVGSSKQRIEFYKRLADIFNFPKIKKLVFYIIFLIEQMLSHVLIYM